MPAGIVVNVFLLYGTAFSVHSDPDRLWRKSLGDGAASRDTLLEAQLSSWLAYCDGCGKAWSQLPFGGTGMASSKSRIPLHRIVIARGKRDPNQAVRGSLAPT